MPVRATPRALSFALWLCTPKDCRLFGGHYGHALNTAHVLMAADVVQDCSRQVSSNPASISQNESSIIPAISSILESTLLETCFIRRHLIACEQALLALSLVHQWSAYIYSLSLDLLLASYLQQFFVCAASSTTTSYLIVIVSSSLSLPLASPI
jgi:hypothetical protein